MIQLVTLLASPLLSLTGSASKTLAVTFSLGCLSFFLLGRNVFHLGGENPRNAWTWLAGIGIGISQISGIVLSLALIAAARGRLMGEHIEGVDGNEEHESEEDQESLVEGVGNKVAADLDEHGEFAGALAGAYSFCGGR